MWSHRQALSLQRWWVLYIHSFGLNIDVLLVTFPTTPHTEVTKKGEIAYTQVVHKNICKLEVYIKEVVIAQLDQSVLL